MQCDAFCEDMSRYDSPGASYLIDFIETTCTVRNFRKRTNLISSFFSEEIKFTLLLLFG